MPRAEHRYLEIGLARYLALRFMGEIDGVDRFDRELRRLQAVALEYPQALIGFDVETLGEPALVARAVSRLHLLRCAVGEAAFRTAAGD
jgi:hypothetical protein